MRGIAGAQITDSGAGSPNERLSEQALAAQAPAPLAAAPQQALKAEASEAASEPELLFAPDFIISQVCGDLHWMRSACLHGHYMCVCMPAAYTGLTCSSLGCTLYKCTLM